MCTIASFSFEYFLSACLISRLVLIKAFVRLRTVITRFQRYPPPTPVPRHPGLSIRQMRKRKLGDRLYLDIVTRAKNGGRFLFRLCSVCYYSWLPSFANFSTAPNFSTFAFAQSLAAPAAVIRFSSSRVAKRGTSHFFTLLCFYPEVCTSRLLLMFFKLWRIHVIISPFAVHCGKWSTFVTQVCCWLDFYRFLSSLLFFENKYGIRVESYSTIIH